MKWLKNISENLVAKAASPLAEEELIDKDIVKQAVIYNDSEARKQLEDYHKTAATSSVIGAALAFPATRKLATKIITHPITEAVGTVTGLHNLVTDQGVKKTIDHVKNEKYGKATLSALGDVLDASPIIGAIKGIKTGYKSLQAGKSIKDAIKTTVDNLPITKFKRILSKENRAKHAFVTINPFGYEKPFKRGFKWLNSVLSDAPVDPNTFKARIEEFVPGMDPDWERFYNQNREDAWRIYNGLEQKWGTYAKNADGTYSYNLSEILKRRPNKKIDWGAPDGNKFGRDNVGGNHGGLTGHTTVEMDGGKTVHYIEDVWDLHPFSRIGDGLSSRIATGLSVPAGEALIIGKDVLKGLRSKGMISTRLSQVGRAKLDDKFKRLKSWTQGVRIPWLDNWLSNLEAGKIIGGTPFTMKTRVPTKTVMQHLYDDVYFPEQHIDDAVDYILPKEPLQLKLNFEDFTNSLENIK